MREVSVRLFGAFRSLGLGREILVPLPDGAHDLRALRAELHARLPDEQARAWLAVSAFASDERVLHDDEAIPSGGTLSILPPVCGG
jgi:molybdopterin converting factor small subunit